MDVQTGEMYNAENAKASIVCCAKELAATLPPFQIKEAPAEYVAKDWPLVSRLQFDEDGELIVVPIVEV